MIPMRYPEEMRAVDSDGTWPCRPAQRNWGAPGHRSFDVGFGVAAVRE
jgi:hypothetical protein